MAGELAWDYDVHDIPRAGLSTVRQATPDELVRIAEVLDLLACSKLAATITLTSGGEGHYRLVGRVQASLQQACGVTLDPISSEIDESFDVSFWPEEDIPAPASGVLDLDDEPEIVPVVAGKIDVGRIVFESLAGAVDPFPRKPDAALDRVSAAPGGSEDAKPDSPFAVLARIKKES